MITPSKIASTVVGEWFSDETDYAGYFPLGFIGALALIWGIALAPFSLLALLLIPAAGLLCVPALAITFSKYSRSDYDIQGFMEEYWSLTKAEKKMLPKGTYKTVVELDQANVTQDAYDLVKNIKAGRIDHRGRNFREQLTAANKAVEIRNQTYQEFM